MATNRRPNDALPASADPVLEADWGKEAEDQARRLAANLGVPDFVYEPVVDAVGSRNRELSDGLLVCGDDGLILQTKTRNPSTGQRDSRLRAESWIRKHAEKARRQVRGTRRNMELCGITEFRSLRGHKKTIHGGARWSGVGIIVHPVVPEGLLLPHEPDVLWITLRDWFALHDWLRSTAAVIGYVERALASGLHPPLGREIERYAVLAGRDRSLHSTPTSLPVLPSRRIEGVDRQFAAFVDEWIEAAANQQGEFAWEHPDEYMPIIELLDRIHPEHRVVLGRKTFETISASDSQGNRTSFHFKLTGLNGRFLFVAAVESAYVDPVQEFMAELSALAFARHEQFVAEDEGLHATLAMGRLQFEDRTAFQGFVYVEDPRGGLDERTRWIICDWYGVYERGTVRSVAEFGRNERCPCRSGQKFKVCHGSPVSAR